MPPLREVRRHRIRRSAMIDLELEHLRDEISIPDHSPTDDVLWPFRYFVVEWITRWAP